MTRAWACTGAVNLLAGGRLSLTAELDAHGPELIVEDVLIKTAALAVRRTAPYSNEGTGGVAQVNPVAEHLTASAVPVTTARNAVSSM